MKNCWWVALRANPGAPVVRVRFHRPWQALFRGRVEIEPHGPDGEGWKTVVEMSLDSTIWMGSKLVDPPHTGSARRVELALSQMVGTYTALTCYRDEHRPPVRDGVVPTAWLARPMPEEEARALLTGGDGGWEPVRDALRDGGELWEFESPAESWDALHGRAGYAVVRDGIAVAAVTDRVS